jgi:hypothetical protein
MQTFLPYPSFEETARCLDYRRLGKQRVEAYQILNTLLGKSDGWKNHPALLMWKGSEKYLVDYNIAICREWIERGYNDTILNRMAMFILHDELGEEIPSFIGDENFHASHRSNLLRKDPVWYGKYGWMESNDLPYVWPSKIVSIK